MTNGGYNQTTEVLGPRALQTYGSEPITPVLSQIAHYLGVLMAHEDERYQSDRQPLSLASGVAAGTSVFERFLPFQAKSITIDNPSGYTLFEPSLFQLIPPNVYDYPLRIDASIEKVVLNVVGGTQATAVTGYVRASEARILPIPILGGASGAAGPTVLLGSTALTDGSGTITLGGTAQNLFSGAIPSHGYEVINPDATNDLWISDTVTAVSNGTGCIRVAANGGTYYTPIGAVPNHAISIVGASTGQKFTARYW